MKKLYVASAMVALLAAATSCDKYDIYPEQYGKVLMIKDAGEKNVTLYASQVTAPYYVSVMKNGHTPEDPAQANLKVLNEEEFGDYKEKYYGTRNFQGLQMLDSKYFYLADTDTVKLKDPEISHTFQSEDDRYFGALVVFNAQAISEWLAELSESDRQNYTYVVPIGLFSPNDSVNADNQYLMLTPVVENPVVAVSIANDAAMIVDQTRAELKDNKTYANDSIGMELVKFSIPCPNPYGFQIEFKNNAKTDVDRFNGHHKDMVLTVLEKRPNGKDDEPRYVLGKDNKVLDYIDFPAGKTEVWLPLRIYRKFMDYDNMADNFVTPVQLSKVKYDKPAGKKDNWTEEEKIRDKVLSSFKLPTSDLKWTPSTKEGSSDDGKYDGYTFFVGYRVVEQPLDLDGGCILGANDPETTEGSFDALFDDDLSTFYHSAWSDEARKDRTPKFGSYLDFEIPKDGINAIAFKFTARVHSNPHGPKMIKLFYSNGKTEAERDDTWEALYMGNSDEINVYPVPKSGSGGSGEVTWLGGITKESDWIKAPVEFRYLRMCVMTNSYDEKLNAMGTKTTGYWNLAELRLYGTKL